ncbi:PH domain-containing protein [Jeotgalibaca sp. MA1X17-3]|uniref:PH domain-containing protein n=1 Tax=Jeotgalibaca sp. MA1X17-3 TaxID=2908211 RepID=UPI001F2A95C2|nr:PH domain-containing protein [Jeotgalibaca sp. MA1X17-3]UJF16635.1 PH domain-containing protein [Jeotgalibaca sp. MA1X17-3]
MNHERKKFHPSVMFVYFIRGIRSWLFLIFMILINSDGISLFQIAAISGILVIVILMSIFKYFTHTYQVTPQKVVVYKGLVKKRETDITYDRIQTIKQRQWFFFKPFHVVELLIETASSTPGEAEASLTAVDISLVEKIEQLRNYSRTDFQKENAAKSSTDTSFQLSNTQISLYALTDMTVFFVLITAFSFLMDWVPDRLFTNVEMWMSSLQWMISIFVFLIGIVVIALLSLLKNFVLFYQFKVKLQNDTLSIEYGLLERKVQKIPLKKIQGVKVNKQVLRNFFGMSTVELILMGGQEKEGEGMASKKVLLFPLIQTKIVYEILTDFLPTMPITEPAIQPVTKGSIWYFWRWMLLMWVPLMIGGWFIKEWVGLVFLVILIISLLYQWAKSQKQGYDIQKNKILCLQQFQGLSTVQLFIAHQNVQSFTRSSSKWLMKKDIGHIEVWFKEGDSPANFDLRFIQKEDSQFIYEHFWKNPVVME